MSAAALGGYEPDLDSIRRDVESLSQLRRSSARTGERASAEWLLRRVRGLGVADAKIQPYRYQETYALAHGLHDAAGIAASAIGGLRGGALAAATLCSYQLEVSGSRQWLRRLLPAGEGANVLARVPGKGRPRAKIVLVAHHDAANTGLIWSPRVVAAGGARHMRRRRVDPFMAPVRLAFCLAAGGSLAPRGGAKARALAAAILGLTMAADGDVARSETVPGACDNASGVAACIDLLRAVVAEPLREVDVLVAFTGSEEAGMGGMAAFLDLQGESLERFSAFVLGLDTLGAGAPIVCTGEGALREQRYHERDVGLVEEGAAIAAMPAPRRWRIGAWTDPILAVHRGLPAASLLSMGPGYFPNYHHPTDTVERVRWASVLACARIAAGTVEAFRRRVTGGRWP
jgi:hypothetical protein